MVVVYAVSLVAGIVGLLVLILGGTFAAEVDRPDRDPVARTGSWGKMAIGALVGFGMGGMSAEFSPLDLGAGVAFAIAVVAAVLSVAWVWYSATKAEP